jgi:dTDP-4-amino-4,6-dideoxygalactose transaminase
VKIVGFLNLDRQYNAHKTGIIEAFTKVCEDTAFSGGAYVKEFEKNFAAYQEGAFASGVSSGTAALHLAMLALEIGAGDEVIVPANTFIATAWGPSHAGAVPVFVDCAPDTWEIDSAKIEAAITAKTKAVIGVHLYGQPFDVDAVKAVADAHHLYLIEDCAQAHGAEYKGRKVGALSDIGCFSFYPGKNLGSYGEGGAVLSNNEAYIKHIDRLKNHGCQTRYYHDEIGYNYRLEGIQGAVLNYKLRFLDEWTARRREIAAMYFEGITNKAIVTQARPSFAKPAFHLFVVTVGDRAAFTAHLNEHGIGFGLHYPLPCHLQKAYRHLGYERGSLPHAEYLAGHCVSLPMFPELSDGEAAYVIDVCNRYKESA